MAGMDMRDLQGSMDPYYAAGLQHMKEQKYKEQMNKAGEMIVGMQEAVVDKEMAAMEGLDEDDFEKLREVRKRKMIAKQKTTQKNVLNGHGRYMELSDQKEFFEACKASEQVVIHFYRPSTLRCQIVDRHLGELAQGHLETRFLKINAEKCPFLVEKLRIIMLPTILCVKNGKTEHSIIGFDELGGADEFPTSVLALVLSSYDVLKYDKDTFLEEQGVDQDELEADAEGGINKIAMNRGPAIREGQNAMKAADDESDSDAEYYEGLDELDLGDASATAEELSS